MPDRLRRLLFALVATVGPLGLTAGEAGAETIDVRPVAEVGREGVGEGEFRHVEDLAFGAARRVYVTDAVHGFVQVFDAATFAFVTRFGGKGDGDDALVKPEGIAVSPQGDVWVADYDTGFLTVYDRDHRPKATVAGYGAAAGSTTEPEFMSIFDGELFLAEAGNHRIDVFGLDGSFRRTFGGSGTEPGRLRKPESAKVSPDGEVYVADLENDRIQVFSRQGTFLRGWGSSGTGQGQLSRPAGIAFDGRGRVFVTEIGNDRVQIFDRTGRFLAMFGTTGSGPGEFRNLHGIAIDPEDGRIWVADTGNNRVQIFESHDRPHAD